MPADRIAHRRLAAVGLVGVIAIAVTSTITAIAYEGAAGERYALLNHWISELGEYANSELAWLRRGTMSDARPRSSVDRARPS